MPDKRWPILERLMKADALRFHVAQRSDMSWEVRVWAGNAVIYSLGASTLMDAMDGLLAWADDRVVDGWRRCPRCGEYYREEEESA